MKKDPIEKNKNRSGLFDLAKEMLIVATLGISLGALYSSPYPIYSKIIFFAVIFLLVLILNELVRNANINIKALDAFLLIFIQLNLMGKKQGIKEDQASKIKEDLEHSAIRQTEFQRMLAGDFEIRSLLIYLVLICVIAFITTIFI